jgi:hypothetical protein
VLAEREMAKAGRPPRNPSKDPTDFRGAETLSDLGISKQQSSVAENVPPVGRRALNNDRPAALATDHAAREDFIADWCRRRSRALRWLFALLDQMFA